MGFTENSKNWEGLAQKDALWAILTDPSKKQGKWDEAEFFETGETEINTILGHLKQHNWIPMGNTALDFGCGVGRLSRALVPFFQRIVGVDVSQTMIEKAKILNSNFLNKIEFRHNTESNLAIIPNSSISFIYSTIVLQHISKPEALFFIEEFLRKLEPQGICVFQLPTADIRNTSLGKKIQERLRIRARLATIGIRKGYQMEMNVFEEEVLDKLVSRERCVILDKQFTNHTHPAYNGNVRFITKEESFAFVSRLYIVQKQS